MSRQEILVKHLYVSQPVAKSKIHEVGAAHGLDIDIVQGDLPDHLFVYVFADRKQLSAFVRDLRQQELQVIISTSVGEE